MKRQNRVTTSQKASKKERAQGLVELGISLFLLLVILAGIVDLGRAIFNYFSLHDAGEEGLIYGLANPTHCNQIEDRVRFNIDSMPGDGPIEVAVFIEDNSHVMTPCTAIAANQVYAGKMMQIDVSRPFIISMPLLGMFFDNQTMLLKGTVKGIILRPQQPTPVSGG